VPVEEEEDTEKKLLLLLTKFFAFPEMDLREECRDCRLTGLRSSRSEPCESSVVACSDAIKPMPSIFDAVLIGSDWADPDRTMSLLGG